MEGNNKFNAGQQNILSQVQGYKTVDIGQVVSIIDENGLDRIKVQINGPTSRGGDNGVEEADLAWCIPMVPKFFSSKPKVGESVFVFTFNSEKKHSDRLYLGPIISQPQYLNNDQKNTSALSVFSFGNFEPSVAIDRIPALKGAFPSNDDISIQGRFNTDIILKTNEVLLRAGKIMETKPSVNNPYSFSFNNKNQAYIQIKNDTIIKRGVNESQDIRGTVTNLVADKINLLTHKDGSPRFNLTNQDNLISDDEMVKIISDAHPMVYGDILLELLRLFKKAFLNHVHNGNGRMATDLTSEGNTQFVAQFKRDSEELEKQLLSKNIRIN